MVDADENVRTYSGTIVAAVLMAVMIAAIAYRYWPSDRREIQRHLSNLAEVLSGPPGESEVAHVTRIAALREYFAPDVRVHVGSAELTNRQQIIDAIGQLTAGGQSLAVEFVDVTIGLAADRETADVTLTARITSTDGPTGTSEMRSRASAVTMTAADGDWVITNVVSDDPLEGPRPQ